MTGSRAVPEPCTLIVFIDDATSRLLALRFVSAETTRADMETLASYLTRHGRPVALYSDRHSIFRVNHPECDGALTQFSRALKTLDIAAIHANSPHRRRAAWNGPTRPFRTGWSRNSGSGA